LLALELLELQQKIPYSDLVSIISDSSTSMSNESDRWFGTTWRHSDETRYNCPSKLELGSFPQEIKAANGVREL
jgi:hypothetical protein